MRARPLGLQDDDAIGDFADRRFLSFRNRGNDLILALIAAVREFLQFDLQVLGAGQFRNNGELDSRSFRGDGDGLPGAGQIREREVDLLGAAECQ